MASGGGTTAEDGSLFDEDNEQSKPLLGEDYERDGRGTGPVLSKKKLAEYLPLPVESLSMVHRVLRGLYGHLPREDVPRIIWVRLLGNVSGSVFLEVVVVEKCFSRTQCSRLADASSRYSGIVSTRPRAPVSLVSRCPDEPSHAFCFGVILCKTAGVLIDYGPGTKIPMM